MLTQKLIDFLGCKNVCQSLASSYVWIPEIVKDYSDGVLNANNPQHQCTKRMARSHAILNCCPFSPIVQVLEIWESGVQISFAKRSNDL
jgi:hypothetical protein